MIIKFKRLMSRPGYRYLVIGGSVYLLELIVIVVAQKMGQSPVIAIGLSFWIGLCISFLLQKMVTFGDRRLNHRVLLPQILAFSLLVVFNFSFTVLAAKLLAHTLPAIIIRTGALGITTIWNFYLYRTRIFKRSDELVY